LAHNGHHTWVYSEIVEVDAGGNDHVRHRASDGVPPDESLATIIEVARETIGNFNTPIDTIRVTVPASDEDAHDRHIKEWIVSFDRVEHAHSHEDEERSA
jgi:hypothetical protein